MWRAGVEHAGPSAWDDAEADQDPARLLTEADDDISPPRYSVPLPPLQTSI
jgi:hypothetical protein